MIPADDVGELIAEAAERIARLFEEGAESSDPAARCPTMDPESMEMLLQFLDATASGEFGGYDIRDEARMWLELALAGWPFDSPTADAALRALVALASVESDDEEHAPDPPATTPLERAVDAALADPAARPALWKALWYGTIFLPVAEASFEDEAGAVFRFVTVDVGGEPAIYGFTTEERLDLVAPDHPVGRVEPTGEELARLWPDDHWLILNPGFSLSTVLSPGEVKGLPDGPTMLFGEDDAYLVEAPAEDPARLDSLLRARRSVPGVTGLRWAVLRSPRPGADRDVLVVGTAEGASPPPVLAAFTEAASRAGFDQAIVLGDDPDVTVGLVAQVLDVGLTVG